MDVRGWVVAASAACSGRGASKPPGIEDARVTAKPAGAPGPTGPAVPIGTARPYEVEAAFDKGDVQIRVEWKDVPVEARASSGRTGCGTAKPAAVAPTTTWGIPDVVVMIDVNHGKAMAASARSRIVLEHCALSPRIALVESPWIIASAMEAPAGVTLARLGPARPLALASPAPSPRATAIQLPIAGHEVAVGVDPDSLAELRSADDSAIAVVPPTPYYAITEPTGQVVLRDVPVGTFEIAAWLPARAGQPARIARGKVTVVAGALAEATLAL